MATSEYVDDLFAEAFACFEQGLCYDEIDDCDNAIVMYERGLNLVKEAENTKKIKKSELYKNIIETRKKVETRMQELKRERSKINTKKATTSQEEKSTDNQKDKDDTVKVELRQQLESVSEGEAELIFFIPDGVQLFIIEGDDTSVPTYPCPLEIFRFNTQTKSSTGVQAEAFMQVGPWVYPLIPEKTRVLKNDVGAYVVPNPTTDHPNMFVGIILPSDLDKQMEEDFYNFLKQFTEVRTQETTRSLSYEEKRRLSEKIAELLIKGGEKVAWGVNFTAEKTSQIVAEQAGKHRSSVQPNEEPMYINPAVATSVHYVHRGSKIVAKCTRYLLDKVGEMGMAMGRQLAASAEKRFGDGRGGGLVSDAINVLGGGVVSASTVWMAMENASKTLCKNIANEAVDTVRVKYGEQASVTAHEALYATGHTSLAALQLWDLGPRSIAGRAARKAGMQLVTDLHKKQMRATLDSSSGNGGSGK